jgi:hypothetical protein
MLTFAPGQTTRSVLVATVDDAIQDPDETFTVFLTGAVGAVVVDGQATGTVRDDDSTKFYVVNDGSTDRTYEYGPFGKAVENYALATGNTAPRGAASTSAGDKVWVVDVNKKVYVYDAAGRPLGSWTAGGLPGGAQLEGITTDGRDVWLVDAKSDKVYRYANAAGVVSGTRTPADSFALFDKGPLGRDYSNANPKDIVTDGTHLWVVNDGDAEDKVFKYTLGGTMVWNNGWSIDPANSRPTGITLDPSNPDHLWIVDAGTRLVYQYSGAVGWVGGGLPRAASATFALAVGNTNPQGIADPPPPAWLLASATPAEASKGVGRSFRDLPRPGRGAWPTTPSVDLAADSLAAFDPFDVGRIVVGRSRR